MKPTFSEFKQMAQVGNLIPVYQEFLADTETPVSAYLKLKDDSYSYLLESAEGGKHWGRYSFIGCKPYLRAISHDSCLSAVSPIYVQYHTTAVWRSARGTKIKYLKTSEIH
jgi:anthranilate/para-aminobenzoate synthase component I